MNSKCWLLALATLVSATAGSELQIDNSIFEIQDNPNVDDPAFKSFSRYVDVFELLIYAEDGFTDEQVLHAAHVLAELLDNDEDGVVDDAALLKQLQHTGFIMPMFNSEDAESIEEFARHYRGDGVSAVLFADEVDPARPGHWGADATVEEIMHTINHRGHVEIYPEAFGLDPGSSQLTRAMDAARGGQYLAVPAKYPDDAWYHYNDKTCDYACMAIEYIYWAQVSNMGILDNEETCEGIADEWEPCTRALLETMDPLIFTLVTDPVYRLPQRAPDGRYSPDTSVEKGSWGSIKIEQAMSGGPHP